MGNSGYAAVLPKRYQELDAGNQYMISEHVRIQRACLERPSRSLPF